MTGLINFLPFPFLLIALTSQQYLNCAPKAFARNLRLFLIKDLVWRCTLVENDSPGQIYIYIYLYNNIGNP